MGAANTWDAMELADQARLDHGSQTLSSSVTIDPSLPPPEMNPRIIALCKDMFKKWSNLDDSRFHIETVSGGITNLLLKVSVKEENGNDVSVTVRLYGPYTEYIINRERELQATNHISDAGFGDKWLGIFENGIATNHISAAGFGDKWLGIFENGIATNHISAAGFGDKWLGIFENGIATKYISAAGFGAKWLGIFENGMVQSFINARTLSPSDMREPKLVAKIAKQMKRFHQLEVPGSKEPQLWNDMFKFYNQASAFEFDDAEKQTTYKTISFDEIHNAILELKGLTDRLTSPVVFSHNDLLSGNIMINEEEDKLYIIDYEYASYNFRGFDIGNHFAEYAGYDCDYNLYPNKDEQYRFFRHYLQPDRPHEVTEEDLYGLYVEANAYSLAAQVFWALWGLIQARVSPIDFDYLGYFFLRYNEYKRRKEECFAMAKSYLSRCIGT